MRKSVAIIGTRGYPSYYGGFETLLRHLIPFMQENGWDVTVYNRVGEVQDEPLPQWSGSGSVRQVWTPHLDRKSLSTITHGFTSSAHAAGAKPDVALVMNVANGYWLPLLRARGIPTTVNVDGMEWERDKWGGAAKRVFKGGAQLTARYADRLIFDAREIERRWLTEFGRVGTYIAYGAEAVANSGAVLGLRSGTYVLYVARFVPENSINEFLEAVERIPSAVDVVIVGSSGFGGDIDERVQRLTQERDNVRWLGHIRDDQQLFALWSHAGAYFHGHSVGGTNPALVQAMACGAPVVARDTVYNREVLGDSAVFVKPTAEAIARGVMDVLGQEARRTAMVEAALARQRSRYTWTDTCAKYCETLDEVRQTTRHHARR